MKSKIIAIFNWVMGKNESGLSALNSNIDNFAIKIGQLKMAIALLILGALGIGVISFILKEKVSKIEAKTTEPVLTIEMADKKLDAEKHWRNYFEENQKKLATDFDVRLLKMEEAQKDMISSIKNTLQQELQETKEKLNQAQMDLSNASLDFQMLSQNKSNTEVSSMNYIDANISEEEFDSGIKFDIPKPINSFVPEGTYFTGYLLGGVVVSTGLNAPQDNAVPVTIKLVPRLDKEGVNTTNLALANNIDLGKCRIMGSAYGDLSSERAIVRLEKMICEVDGSYVTSDIAGQIFGPDGFNGLKGTVIATSNKHIANASIASVIAGLSSSLKGQEATNVTASGILQIPGKSAGALLGSGAINGATNASDKLAEYFLRQAEAMSPVLTIPAGVRINTQITKGFFVGELNIRKKISAARKASSNNTSKNNTNNTNNANNFMENISYE